MIKRIFLFLITNLAVVLTIGFFLNIFHIQPYITHYGLNIEALLFFCFIWGMAGAFISLLLSKPLAKWSMHVQIIDPKNTNSEGLEILRMIEKLSQKANINPPEIGIYESNEVNAFATGFSKNRSLVAVSSGLLKRLNEKETCAVLGHEISHISNGDMVTMSLLQGIVNSFVMFLARVIAAAVANIGSKDKNSYASYRMFVFLFEIVFMILGSMLIFAFSRHREYKADAGGANLTDKFQMIAALKTLRVLQEIKDKETSLAYQTLKISAPAKKTALNLFASHPTFEERIERLNQL